LGASISGCATTNALESRPCHPLGADQFLPPLNQLVRGDEWLESLSLKVECAGIAGVGYIPDGWTVTVVPKGEDSIATIRPPQRPSEKPTFLATPPQFSILGRGQYSDCIRISLDVEALSGSSKVHRHFENELDGAQWKERQ
jgi:hypothetical protein